MQWLTKEPSWNKRESNGKEESTCRPKALRSQISVTIYATKRLSTDLPTSRTMTSGRYSGRTSKGLQQTPSRTVHCAPTAIRDLRKLLRKNGVWVTKDRHILVAQSLHNTLAEDEPTEWTSEAIREHLSKDGPINSHVLEHAIREILSLITTPENKPSPTPPPAHRVPPQGRAPTPFSQMPPPRRPLPPTRAPTPIILRAPTPILSRAPTPAPIITPLRGLFSPILDSTPAPPAPRHRELPVPTRGIPSQNLQAQTGQDYKPRQEFGHGPDDRTNQRDNEFYGNSRNNHGFGNGDFGNTLWRNPEQGNNPEPNIEGNGSREPNGRFEGPNRFSAKH